MFLGYLMNEQIPHFSTVSYNFKHRYTEKTIEETYKLFESFGMPMHLKDVGIDESRLKEMAHHVAENEGLDSAWAPLKEDDILSVFKESL